EFDKAVGLYKKLLKIAPDQSLVCNNIACVLLEQKKFKEASEWFTRSLTLMPQLLRQFGNVLTTLANVLPPIGAAVERALSAWPKCLPPEELLKPYGLRDIADNPLLLFLLRSSPMREIGFERLLIAIRFSLLKTAADLAPDVPIDTSLLELCGAL